MSTLIDADQAYPNAVRMGYARVSTRSQDHRSQLDALAGASCRDVVVETVSSRRELPRRDALIRSMHPGDTLVVYKPDRLARTVRELLNLLEEDLRNGGINLEILTGVCAGTYRPTGSSIPDKMLFMVAAMAAEMEREMIRERTLAGLAAAAAAGRHGGRPRVIDEDQLAAARARRERGEPVASIAKRFGVGRTTMYDYLAGKIEPASPKPVAPTN